MDEDLTAEARGWLADCGSTRDRTDAEVKAAIERHYTGGWDEFRRDAEGGQR